MVSIGHSVSDLRRCSVSASLLTLIPELHTPESLDAFLALPAHEGVPLPLLSLMIAETSDRAYGTTDAVRLVKMLSPAQCEAIEDWRAAHACDRCGRSGCKHTFTLTGDGFVNHFLCESCAEVAL
jgi:hypothetical protein